jgi:hypothetical protein
MFDEPPSVNNMIKTVGQPRTDFASVNYDEFPELNLHHLHFYHNHTISLLVNQYVKKSLWLMHVFVLYDVFGFV